MKILYLAFSLLGLAVAAVGALALFGWWAPFPLPRTGGAGGADASPIAWAVPLGLAMVAWGGMSYRRARRIAAAATREPGVKPAPEGPHRGARGAGRRRSGSR